MTKGRKGDCFGLNGTSTRYLNCVRVLRPGSGDAGLERPGKVSKADTSSFVDDGGETGRESECILEVGSAGVRHEGTEARLKRAKVSSVQRGREE